MHPSGNMENLNEGSIILDKWVTITGAPSFQKFVGVWLILVAWKGYKVFTFFLTAPTCSVSSLHQTSNFTVVPK